MPPLDHRRDVVEGGKDVSVAQGPVVAASHPRPRDPHDGAEDDEEIRGGGGRPGDDGVASRHGNGNVYWAMTEPQVEPDRWGERLARRLGLWSAVAVVVGTTIGSGIFRTPASVAQLVGDVPLFLVAWVLGGAVALAGALTYAELAAAFPRSGGIYVFLREGFGPLPAFLFGWAELWIIRPGAFGAIGITASAYTLRTLGLDPAAEVAGLPLRAEQALGAAYILIVAAVNYYGIHRGAVLQNVSTALKVGALALLVLIGLARGDGATAGEITAQRAAVG